MLHETYRSHIDENINAIFNQQFEGHPLEGGLLINKAFQAVNYQDQLVNQILFI